MSVIILSDNAADSWSLYLSIMILNNPNFSFRGSRFIFSGQGLIEYLSLKQNQLLSILLMLQRVFHGFVGQICCQGTVLCCRAWFPDHVNFTVGLVMSMNFLGGGLSIFMGGYIYQQLGFKEPFYIAASLSALCWLYNLLICPSTSDPLFSNAKPHTKAEVQNENSKNSDSEGSDETGLSPLIAFPLAAHALVSLLEGFIAAITTPYLHDKFAIEIDEGSGYLLVMFISFTIGSAGAGYILQKCWLTSYRTMETGASLSILGLFLIFPGQRFPRVYAIVPKLAYVGTAFIGLGCQLISIASLPALEETQVNIAGRSYSTKNKSRAASLWVICWMVAVFSGHMVVLMVMKFMTYTQGGWMMAGCSLLSLFICVVLEVVARRYKAREGVLASNDMNMEGTMTISNECAI